MAQETRAPRRLWILVVLSAAAVLVAASVVLSDSAFARKRAQGRKVHKPNRKEQRLIELGRRLFYDPLVSRTGTVSCASCHQPEYGFSDPRRFSPDENGTSGRHSQPILDSRENKTAHWDGEFSGGAEELVLNRLGRVIVYYGGTSIPGPSTTPPPAPPPSRPASPTTPGGRGPLAGRGRRPTAPGIGNPGLQGGPGVGTTPAVPAPSLPTIAPRRVSVAVNNRIPLNPFVANKVQESERYDEAFRAVWGSANVTLGKLSEAIGAYCHSIESTESPYDRFKAGDEDAMSEAAQRGLALFEGRAGCADCHSTAGKHALFTDYDFHNTGLSWRPQSEDLLQGDGGRIRFSSKPHHTRAFKTPTLRDVTKRGPYMHDGRFDNLTAVVRYYAEGGSSDPLIDKRIAKGFEASEQDVKDIVAFLENIAGDERAGLARTAWKARAEKTRLRFVNPDGKPVARLPVRLVPAGDRIPVEGAARTRQTILELETDKSGEIEFQPLAWTHARIELHDGLVEIPDPLVPDTLKKAELTLPIQGRVELVLVAPRNEFAPARVAISGQARRTQRLRAGPAIATEMRMKRISKAVVGQMVVAKYEGWLPVNLGERLWLTIPGFTPNDASVLHVQFDRHKKARVDLTR